MGWDATADRGGVGVRGAGGDDRAVLDGYGWPHGLSDEEILAVIRREVKQHRESLSEFEKAGRTDLIAEEKAQLEVLLTYLPPQMSQEEITLAVQQAIAETKATGPEHLGQVMRILMPRLQGRADGSTVHRIVRELLSTREHNEDKVP